MVIYTQYYTFNSLPYLRILMHGFLNKNNKISGFSEMNLGPAMPGVVYVQWVCYCNIACNIIVTALDTDIEGFLNYLSALNLISIYN